jgi:hypothetical protein
MCIPPIVARQWFGNNVTVATNTHATIEELLDTFFMQSVLYQGKAAISSSQNFMFLLLKILDNDETQPP